MSSSNRMVVLMNHKVCPVLIALIPLIQVDPVRERDSGLAGLRRRSDTVPQLGRDERDMI